MHTAELGSLFPSTIVVGSCGSLAMLRDGVKLSVDSHIDTDSTRHFQFQDRQIRMTFSQHSKQQKKYVLTVKLLDVTSP